MKNPHTLPDYRFCRHTVTLYHRLAKQGFAVEKRVFRGAFLDMSLVRKETEGAAGYEQSFLLVLPSGLGGRPIYLEPAAYDRLSESGRRGFFTLCPGDKIAEGEGPDILSAADWAAFTGKAGAGLVKETAARRLGEQVLHLEAGSGGDLGRSSLPHPRKGLSR